MAGAKLGGATLTNADLSGADLGAATVTDGRLVFTGKVTGEFVAPDADTGATLWQFKTSSSVNSTAITYTHKGRRFVSVAAGLGGPVISRFAPSQVPAAGTLRTFALMPE
jgi:alcohol dehydrogenase (cytochrome c)